MYKWFMVSVWKPHLGQEGSSQGRFSLTWSVFVTILSWKVWKGIESGDCLLERKEEAIFSDISLLMSGW